MPLTFERPLVGERVDPGRNGAIENETADVLNDRGLLIVRLFEEKAVVLNWAGSGRGAINGRRQAAGGRRATSGRRQAAGGRRCLLGNDSCWREKPDHRREL